MTGSRSPARLVAAAAICLGVAGAAGVAWAATNEPPVVPPSSEPESTLGASTTSGPPAFTGGEDARAAAEELLGAYVESEYGVAVTDAACSVPPTGAVGDQFVCYALQPGALVIALRATVGEQRLIGLELLFDQPPTTTTTTPAAESANTAG
jgi:hypothetical protein